MFSSAELNELLYADGEAFPALPEGVGAVGGRADGAALVRPASRLGARVNSGLLGLQCHPYLEPAEVEAQAVAAAADSAQVQEAPRRETRRDAEADLSDDAREARASHGASEKQRRDRINAKIDELRLLVPSLGVPRGERSRSKLVVLQESIDLIKSLQCTISEQGCEIRRLAESSPAANPLEGLLRQPPPREGTALGVNVHCGDCSDVMYVQVCCPDRRGLLGDVMASFRGLALSVVRAAVTTTPDGFAHDVFEVKHSDASGGAAEPLDAQAIRLAFVRELGSIDKVPSKRTKPARY